MCRRFSSRRQFRKSQLNGSRTSLEDVSEFPSVLYRFFSPIVWNSVHKIVTQCNWVNVSYVNIGAVKAIVVYKGVNQIVCVYSKIGYEKYPQKSNVWLWVSKKNKHSNNHMGCKWISTCTSRIYFPVGMKFSIKDTYEVLLNTCVCRESRCREVCNFLRE
jgi:hypothetical protein